MEHQEARPGTYAVTEEMPHQPDEVPVYRYLAPNTLGNAETEEAAARLVIFCQSAGLWCGMGTRNLVTQLRKDEADTVTYHEAMAAYQSAMEAYQSDLVRHSRKTLLTLGIYRLFVPAPKPPEIKEPAQPYLTVTVLGFDYLWAGFSQLIERGLVVKTRDEQHNEDVLYPTAQLVRALGKARP